MHSVCRCSLPVWRRSFLKKGTPRDLFWPRPGSAPGGIWPKNNNTCKGPWVLHPYQVSSKSIQRFWRRSRKCEKFTDGRTTDGRTDDGRCAMTIAHSSLRLRWAKKKQTEHGDKNNHPSWSPPPDPVSPAVLYSLRDKAWQYNPLLPKEFKIITGRCNISIKLEPQGALIAHLSTMSTSVNKLE